MSSETPAMYRSLCTLGALLLFGCARHKQPPASQGVDGSDIYSQVISILCPVTPRDQERTRVARMLLKMDPTARMDLIRSYLLHNDPKRALGALSVAGEMVRLLQDEGASDELKEFRELKKDIRPFLWHASPRFRKSALGIFLLWGDRSDSREISVLLDDPDPAVVTTAIVTLSFCGDASSVLMLVRKIETWESRLTERPDIWWSSSLRTKPVYQLQSWKRISAKALRGLTGRDWTPEQWLEWHKKVKDIPLKDAVRWNEQEERFDVILPEEKRTE